MHIRRWRGWALPTWAPLDPLLIPNIRTDAAGRYCLNDFHKAAGGERRQRPGLFLRLDQTDALVAEIEKGGIKANCTDVCISAVRTQHGRFSLGDLHKAGNLPAHKLPNAWTRLGGTAELITELRAQNLQCVNSRSEPIEVQLGGMTPGTYVVKELVYAYAMWCSPRFHLQVIRTFDALVTQELAELRKFAPVKLKKVILDGHGSLRALPEALVADIAGLLEKAGAWPVPTVRCPGRT